jgi:hypothetical protein
MKFHSSKNYKHYESLRVFLREKLISCARRRPHPHPRPLTLASLLACALLVSACDAQKLSAVLGFGPTIQEPALTGKVIDYETKLPLAGAFVYGHYVTATGTLGGGTRAVDLVKSFAVETDANGVFKLEAWDSGDRSVKGGASDRFPFISLWKPGYDVSIQGLGTIREFNPEHIVLDPLKPPVPFRAPLSKERKNATSIDLIATPIALKPVKTEKERYDAVRSVGDAMAMSGACGWELYAKILLAQHNEWKEFLKRNIPPENLDKEGYGKSGYFHPERWLNGVTVRSSVDRLLSRYRASAQGNWKCSRPDLVFGEKK